MVKNNIEGMILEECDDGFDVSSCIYPFIKIDDGLFERDNTYFDVNQRCHDCNIVNKEGNYHHFGCDMETCPKCSGQLIDCSCDVNGILKKTPQELKDEARKGGE